MKEKKKINIGKMTLNFALMPYRKYEVVNMYKTI